MKRPTRSQRLRDWARGVKRDGVALYFALRHPETPWLAKALAYFVVAYALSPIDLIPDIIPVLGYLDDVLLLPGLIWLAVRLVPSMVMAQCRARADEWMKLTGRKPSMWIGAALVLAIWVALAVALWWWVQPGRLGWWG
jgi:uncharacterized membrane protein YkvA (DUF1232 family)